MIRDRIALLKSPKLRERGLGAIWLAIGMGLFLSFAAMAIDVGNWYYRRTAVQTATDAAALAGAALLPADEVNAQAEAFRVALNHGFTPDEVEVSIVDGSILEITIRERVDNFFLPALGFGDQTTIAATAVAEYEGNVAMGSPENIVGNDPEGPGPFPDFNVLIEGPGEDKTNGDRFSTTYCSTNDTSYCDTSLTIDNVEFTSDGYFFAVEVLQGHGQDLVFELFDPAYIAPRGGASATSCSDWTPVSSERTDLFNLTNGADYVGWGGLEIPEDYHDIAATRYQSGRNEWCLGDRLGESDEDPMDVSVIIREPDDTPWNPLDNPPISQIGCEPNVFEGWLLDNHDDDYSFPSAYELLDPTDSTYQSSGEWSVDLTDPDWTFAEIWRQWVEVCRIPAPFLEQGKYLIQVSSARSIVDPLAYDATKDERGLNGYSIRAGFDDGSGTPATYDDVRVYAEGHLPIHANADSANPTFHLARVLEVGRDRTLTVELFDAGDAGSAGSIQVIPPPDSNMAAFPNCVFDLEGTGTPSNVDASICKVSNVSSSTGYQGKVMLIQVPIPASYTCDETVSTGCWVTLEMGFSDVYDVTTWSAYISGDPVRLIE